MQSSVQPKRRCFIEIDCRSGERRTGIVASLTAAMMVAEITIGYASGSMAVLADGLHMG
ncbi:MAG: cation transporter, partial [Bryobacteraceae bacterium]|nr:cation transporter [Bryobacteraceae bacterium]